MPRKHRLKPVHKTRLKCVGGPFAGQFIWLSTCCLHTVYFSVNGCLTGRYYVHDWSTKTIRWQVKGWKHVETTLSTGWKIYPNKDNVTYFTIPKYLRRNVD